MIALGTANIRRTNHGRRRAWLRFLSQHRLCILYEREGRTEAADVVDRDIPHKGDLALFWDQDNWQVLCASHHNSHKHSHEKGGRGRQAHSGVTR